MNNREIKFKAWHKPTSRMFEVHALTPYNVYENSMDGVFSSPTLPAVVEDCELLQYAGCKTEQGKEVFEGDIAKGIFRLQTGERKGNGRDKNRYAVYDDFEVIGIVIFDSEKSAFYFETDFSQEYKSSFFKGIGLTKYDRIKNESVIMRDSPKDYLHKVVHKLEIIGNIFENPELLK